MNEINFQFYCYLGYFYVKTIGNGVRNLKNYF